MEVHTELVLEEVHWYGSLGHEMAGKHLLFVKNGGNFPGKSVLSRGMSGESHVIFAIIITYYSVAFAHVERSLLFVQVYIRGTSPCSSCPIYHQG